jgi:hypothetical protein
MGEKSGSGIRILVEQPVSYSESLETIFLCSNLKYLESLMWIRDPRWNKFGSWMEKFGSGITIPDPQTPVVFFNCTNNEDENLNMLVVNRYQVPYLHIL